MAHRKFATVKNVYRTGSNRFSNWFQKFLKQIEILWSAVKISFKCPFFGTISKTGLNQLISISTIPNDPAENLNDLAHWWKIICTAKNVHLANSTKIVDEKCWHKSIYCHQCPHVVTNIGWRKNFLKAKNYLKRSFHKCQLHTSVPDRTNSFGSIRYIIWKFQIKNWTYQMR